MEPALIAVTVVSLGLAVAMAVVAWTLIRSERERAAARAEALQALAFEEDPGERGPVDTARRHDVGAGEDDDPGAVEPHTATERPSWDLALGADTNTGDLFEPAPPTSAATRRWLAVAAVGLLIVAGYVTASALRTPEVVAAIAASNPVSGGRPIELLSLRHGVDSDGSFVVTGFVQNPADGADLSDVDAVVYLFDQADQYFATGRAALESATLHAGGESPFVVRIPNVTGVNRYRVGFRRANGVVTHVDRRGHLPDGTTGDTLPPLETARPAGGLR